MEKNLTIGINPSEGRIGDNNLLSCYVVTLFIIMVINYHVSYEGHFTPEA